MTARQSVQLVPVVLAVHNAEEAITMPRLLPHLHERLPEALRAFAPDITTAGFLAALAGLTALGFLVLVVFDLQRPRSAGAYILLAVQATLLLNVAVHVTGALVLKGYVPGLVTALAINFPYSVYLLRRAWHERWFTGGELAALAPIALALHGPVLFFVLRMASA